MRYNKGTKQLMADGHCLVRTSWTDGSYLMMNSGGVVYKVTPKKNGKLHTEIFDPSTQYYMADDYDIKRTFDDHSS